MTGENALALDQLEMLSTIPGDFHFGGLLVELDWVPTRREPEFRALLAQMAPKIEKKLRMTNSEGRTSDEGRMTKMNAHVVPNAM